MEKYISEKMLHKDDKYILCYKNGCIIVRDASSKDIVKKTRIHSILKSATIVERFFRFEPRVCVRIEDGKWLFSDCGVIKEYDLNNNTTTIVHQFNKGMHHPLSFCVRFDENRNIKKVLYGEYMRNVNKDSVSIYEYDMTEWKEVYSFPCNTIKHIHNIVFDEIRNRYLILTGDDDLESAIWEADSSFKMVRQIIGGNQNCRACVLLTTKDGILYATDTPLEKNYIYKLGMKGRIEKMDELPGPVIYGAIYKGDLYVATSVEGNPKSGKWNYMLSNKLGPGVCDRFVHIIRCNSKGDVVEITKFHKDWLPMSLFQFGNAQLIESDDGVYATTQSVVEKGTYKIV